jgi:hypothetical protein
MEHEDEGEDEGREVHCPFSRNRDGVLKGKKKRKKKIY